MISFHTAPPVKASSKLVAKDWKHVDTDDIERIKKCITKFIWSAIHFKDGERDEEHFISANWCVYDFDDGELTLEEACRIFCDRVHIIGTTNHHQIAKENSDTICDRFRVLLKFTEPITDVAIYKYNMKMQVHKYPMDRKTIDGARFWWPCKEIVQSTRVDENQDDLFLEDVIKEIPKWFDKPINRTKKHGGLPSWTRWALENVFPIREYNDHCHRVALDLYAHGRDEKEILEIILNSPTYKNKTIDSELSREIQDTIKNAVKKIHKRMQQFQDPQNQTPKRRT